MLRTSPERGHKSYKSFVVVFVCLSTIAVHLDAVTDYSASAFLAAFRRFTSRRGLCSELRSDCGTNFVGADAELRQLFAAHSREFKLIADKLANLRVRWRFNPPAASHFGGIWEAAVKACKHHLRRVMGETTLTYEEMATLLAQIKACLNSRLLAALSDDPEDLAALTPGYFLMGGPLNAVPEPSLVDISTNALSRWQLVQRMRDHFWERWTRDYMLSLLSRPKWRQVTDAFQVGRLCLIRSETTPPTRWPLGRVIQMFPGEDGLTRVVKLRTASSELTRPIVKLVLLSSSSETDCSSLNAGRLSVARATADPVDDQKL
ncbi:uncharacterized protein [Cardiocondyla obscurior]|uniref:uncharacterized protein n=1 Tax=Cardiocondyla obscurior TaxID=286306 RepID=UPI003965890F